MVTSIFYFSYANLGPTSPLPLPDESHVQGLVTVVTSSMTTFPSSESVAISLVSEAMSVSPSVNYLSYSPYVPLLRQCSIRTAHDPNSDRNRGQTQIRYVLPSLFHLTLPIDLLIKLNIELDNNSHVLSVPPLPLFHFIC